MSVSNAIPKRSEVDKQNTWAIEDLFASDEQFLAELEACKAYPGRLAAYRGKLGGSADTLYEFMLLCDEVNLRLHALGNYAFRKSDEDTSNAKYLDFRDKVVALDVEIDSASSFYTPEILAISDENMEKFYSSKPELELYRRHFTEIRRRREHTLSDAEERLLAAAGEMAEGPATIGEQFRDADLKFPDAVDSSGNRHRLTQATYIPLVQSPDRVLRKSAFENLYHTFDSFKNTAAALLNAQVKQLMFFARSRKYPSTMAASLDRSELTTDVYFNLIKAVNDNLPSMHRYVALRKKLMKLDELHMYDLYTPIVADAEQKTPFDQAKKNVLEGLAVLGDEYIGVLKEGFEKRWIDVYENEGKRSGAYSAGGRPHPYVLLNYKDTLDSQFTLAHEMGHALHSYFSVKTQPNIYSHYVIFVAEVASTCNEVLLMRHLLDKTSDRRQRAYLINHFLEQFRATLYRQTMFAEFEMEINRAAEQGESLTAQALSERYYALNEKYYGKDMVIDKEIAMEWARIPHFFYDFYVFQYATGFSAAVAIANRILAEGKSAVDDYLKFLSSGRIADPISLLKIAGVDMTTKKPIADAIDLFDKLLDEMEELSA